MAEETESMTEGKIDRMIGTEIEIKLGSETGADIDDHMSDTTEERENPAGRPKRKKQFEPDALLSFSYRGGN